MERKISEYEKRYTPKSVRIWNGSQMYKMNAFKLVVPSYPKSEPFVTVTCDRTNVKESIYMFLVCKNQKLGEIYESDIVEYVSELPTT